MERISLVLARVMALDFTVLKREEGQTVTEYGLVLAFVAVALLGVLVALKGGIKTFIDTVNTAISALPGFTG